MIAQILASIYAGFSGKVAGWYIAHVRILVLLLFAASSMAEDVVLECVVQSHIGEVHFESTPGGKEWEFIGASPVCRFTAHQETFLACYRAKAIDGAGQESGYSNLACHDVRCH